ncbi:MAG TPA: transcription-repair coupling factor [Candidatus Margulisiibacteriota bacterium]|nr:transcription-repair coupling factor [Candidatus Margulisiibacteriota bacterium]
MTTAGADCERAVQHLHAGVDAPGTGASTRRLWRVQGLKGGARPYFVWRFLAQHPRPALIILPSGKDAEAFVDDLRFLHGEDESAPPFARRIHYFPAWDVAPFEDLSPTAETVAARIEGLYHLLQTKDPLVVTTAEALLQRVPPKVRMADRLRYMVEGDEVDLDALATQLDDWGYRRVPLVEDRGDFSVRGGILDIFPPAHPQPLRIELLGDVIETIREFDPVSQRSLDAHPEFLILPVREFDAHGRSSREALRAIEARALDLEVGRDERSQILDGLTNGLLFPGVEFFLPYFHPALDTLAAYLPPQTLVWMDGAGEVDAALEQAWATIERRAGERTAEHRFFPPIEQLYLSPAEWRVTFRDFSTIELEPLDVLAATEDHHHLSVHSFLTRDLKIERTPGRKEVSFGPVAKRVRAWCEEGQRVIVVVSTPPQVERLGRLFENHDVTVERVTAIGDALAAAVTRPRLLVGHLSAGFRIPDERLVIITEADIFGEARQRRRTRKVEVTQLLKNLSELKPEDFVVHIDHGVGRYRGLKHLRVADIEGDYLHLDYADGDRLYLPVDRISLVQKYVGADGTTPALDKLGGTSWERVKRKTRESIFAMAKELLDIYAAREIMEGKAFSAPDPYFREFEAAFPFEETPDQLNAITDVLGDMQRTKPMDRLICGDVGYGKTEVAMRAAFLAVLDGRQVAVLVPTTVLAQQHYNTFRQRFQGHPVRVEMLSRFLTRGESQAVVKGVANGEVDIVIGTHRLLQKDIAFKNLGLLVIDEEHRFGVKDKEQIKQMRKLVDVLTLTATPIPRTLQMSLLGIRDLSVIETPPIDRLAIRTYVTRYDEGIIRESILRELARGGQVFFVHNRVETIEIRARRLRELVPEATFAVAHGQMHEHDLERVMADFFSKKVTVLVCSAIIESGLDVPNANTIIIDRADHFGLAQLYQLRGRVGRSHERAYAYLMIPGEQLISRDAQMRLRALQELDDLGGGFKLAAHDLEIRGAGNLLGKQQSGQIAAVGFELYEQMMEEAVHELRGEQVHHEVEPEIQLGIPAFIPESYIADENQRLVFYRRLAAIRGRSDLDEIANELRDRYGPLPPTVDSFLRIMALRRTLKDHLVVRAALRDGAVTLQFHPDAPVSVDKLVAMVHRGKGRFKLSADFQLSFRPDVRDWDGLIEETKAVLQAVREAC